MRVSSQHTSQNKPPNAHGSNTTTHNRKIDLLQFSVNTKPIIARSNRHRGPIPIRNHMVHECKINSNTPFTTRRALEPGMTGALDRKGTLRGARQQDEDRDLVRVQRHEKALRSRVLRLLDGPIPCARGVVGFVPCAADLVFTKVLGKGVTLYDM